MCGFEDNPVSGIIAAEIIENVESALSSFKEIVEGLNNHSEEEISNNTIN